jgi:hypothetical protein
MLVDALRKYVEMFTYMPTAAPKLSSASGDQGGWFCINVPFT